MNRFRLFMRAILFVILLIILVSLFYSTKLVYKGESFMLPLPPDKLEQFRVFQKMENDTTIGR